MKTSFILSICLNLSAVFNLATQILLGKIFGAGQEMDSYLLAISLPLTTNALICGPLANLLIPEFSSQQLKWQMSGVSKYLIRSLTPYLCLVACLGFFFQNGVTRINLNPYLIASAMAWILLPLNVGILILTSVVQVNGFFFLFGVTALFPPFTSFLFCLLVAKSTGIEWALGGQLFGIIVVFIYLLGSQSANSTNVKGIKTRIIGNMPIALLGTLIFCVYPISDAYWGKVVGVSTTSHLAYAQKIIVGLSGLIVAASNIIAFQKIADFASGGKNHEVRKYLITKIITVVDFVLPMSIIVGAIAKTFGLAAIQIFDAGRLNAEDVNEIAKILQPMLVGMVFMSTMGFIFKTMIAEKRTSQAALISVIGSVLYFVLSGLFLRFAGSTGIGYAYLVTWAVVFLISATQLFTYKFICLNICDANSDLGIALFRNILAALVSCGLVICLSIFSEKTNIPMVGQVIFKIASVVFVFKVARLTSLSNFLSSFHVGYKKIR